MDDALTLEVPAELEGSRVDKAISSILGVSRAQARAMLEEGVLRHGAPVKPSDRVTAGDVLETPPLPPPERLFPEPVPFGIIHEDQALIVVDKPPGIVVHPGAGRLDGTLAAGLLHRFPDLEGVGAEGRWGLVHRLDRDTSGVLLVGRTRESFEKLSADIAARRVGRTYLALVHGVFATETGSIDAPIGRDPSRPTRRAVVAGGKQARTNYEVVEEFPDSGLTLVRVALDTGRTHQIRVHMAAIDHPILGDTTYSTLNKPVSAPRVFLHAQRVELEHPVSGEPVSYESPLPEDLARVLESVRRGIPG